MLRSLPGPDPLNTPGSDSPGNLGESLSIKRAGLGVKPTLRNSPANLSTDEPFTLQPPDL